jgi:hypothetical protein
VDVEDSQWGFNLATRLNGLPDSKRVVTVVPVGTKIFAVWEDSLRSQFGHTIYKTPDTYASSVDV